MFCNYDEIAADLMGRGEKTRLVTESDKLNRSNWDKTS